MSRFTVGSRVRIRGEPSGIKLTDHNGTVIEVHPNDSYIIRLDYAAITYDIGGPDHPREYTEIVEVDDNLDPA